MKNVTASKVGTTLGRAGFQSQRGVTWARGFKASKFMPGTVAVTANMGSEARDREALEAYTATLVAAGFEVDNQETTLFVS